MPIRVDIQSDIPEFIEQLKEAALASQIAGGEVLSEEFFKRIISQPADWPALAERTIRQKGHDTMLIQDGHLLSCFQVGSEPDGAQISGEMIHVGVEDNNPASAYALAQEFGTEKIPSRSYIRSSLNDQTVLDRTRDAVVSTMRAELGSDEDLD